jgi:Ni/Co efflux regulator RcnB
VRSSIASILFLGAAVAAAPALADKPDWAGRGHGQGDRHERESSRHERHGFDARARERVHAYYAREMRRGHCPPGLKKKRNGCAPPGMARKWKVGEPLPSDVAVQPLPPQIKVEIGVPPAGYRYVQVANDILMIAAGTGMVVDAINDLGR